LNSPTHQIFVGFPQVDLDNIGNGDVIFISTHEFDHISRTNFTFLHHRKVDATQAAAQKPLHHIVSPKLEVELKAGKSGLRHHDFGSANAKAIANIHSRF
jgi:hypothetical protein